MTGQGTFDADAFLAGEPLNVDPVLVAILEENRAIQRARRAHHTFAPSSDPASLLPIIAACDLDALRRHPESYTLYAGKFKQTVRRRYASMEAYLRERLGWDDAADTKARAKEDEYFVAGGEPGKDLRVALNEWPYAIESNVAHICVWSRRPLLHRALASSAREWAVVSHAGLSGFTNLPASYIASLPRGSRVPTSAAEARGTCAQEIARFVERRWSPDDGFTTAYFVNPPALQSVRGLSHFHVLVKRRPSSEPQP